MFTLHIRYTAYGGTQCPANSEYSLFLDTIGNANLFFYAQKLRTNRR